MPAPTEPLPPAYVCHYTSDRARVRIPSRRGDAAFFARIRTRMRGCPGVETLQINPSTASVLMLHPKNFALDRALDFAQREGLFCRAGEGQARLGQSARNGVRRIDAELRKHTGGEVDLAGAAFVALAGCALYQLLRGEVLAPAATLLWYAAGTLSDKENA